MSFSHEMDLGFNLLASTRGVPCSLLSYKLPSACLLLDQRCSFFRHWIPGLGAGMPVELQVLGSQSMVAVVWVCRCGTRCQLEARSEACPCWWVEERFILLPPSLHRRNITAVCVLLFSPLWLSATGKSCTVGSLGWKVFSERVGIGIGCPEKQLESLSLEAFQKHADVVLSNIVLWMLIWVGGWTSQRSFPTLMMLWFCTVSILYWWGSCKKILS